MKTSNLAVPAAVRRSPFFSPASPAKTGCLAIVTGQRVPESLIDALVDQNAHLRACEQEVFCFFKGSNGRFTRDGGKSLQKVFECFSALEVVEQRLNRHSGSAKHRTSPKNVRVFDDDSHEVIVSRAIVAKIASPGQVGTGAEPPLQGRSFCFNARRAGALPIPGSAGARFPASAPPARRWFQAAVLLRTEACRHYSGELPPAGVPRFPEFRSEDCSIRGAAPRQNLLRLRRVDRERWPQRLARVAGGSGRGPAPKADILFHHASRSRRRPHRAAPKALRAAPPSQSPPLAHTRPAKSPRRRAAEQFHADRRIPARWPLLPAESPPARHPRGFGAPPRRWSPTRREVRRYSARIPSWPQRTTPLRPSLPIWFVPCCP